MDAIERQERGRQDAFAKLSMGQERDTAVMAGMVQLMQGAQDMSMRRLSTINPEAHRILDAPRRRDKQRRRRHRANDTRNERHDGVSMHPVTADVETPPRAKRSTSLPAPTTTSKAAPMLPPSMSSSITKPPSMSPPSTPPPPMVVAAAVERQKAHTERQDSRNEARRPRDRSRNRDPTSDVPHESERERHAVVDRDCARRHRDRSRNRASSRDEQPESKRGPIVTLRPGPDASDDTKRAHRKDCGHPASSSKDDTMRTARPSSCDGKDTDKYTQNRRSGGGLRNSGSLDDVIRRDRL